MHKRPTTPPADRTNRRDADRPRYVATLVVSSTACWTRTGPEIVPERIA